MKPAALRPGALIEANRRSRSHIQALGAPRHRNAHPSVGLLGELRRQSVGLGTEQPCRRAREVGLVERRFAVHSGGHDPQAGAPQRGDRRIDVGCDDNRHREDAARRGAQALAVVGVDAVTDEHDRGSAHRVRDANQCAGIAGLTDLHTDGDKPRILREYIRQDGARVLTHRYHARRE